MCFGVGSYCRGCVAVVGGIGRSIFCFDSYVFFVLEKNVVRILNL